MPELQPKYGVKVSVADKTAAEAVLRVLQTDLKEVSSAYVPSGIIHSKTILWMLVAAPFAGVVAALAGGLAVALTLSCTVGGAALFARAFGASTLVAAILTVILLVGLCASFIIAGWAAGRIVAALDHRTANRNRMAAGIFGSVAGSVAVLLLAYFLPEGVRYGWQMLAIPTGDVSGVVVFGWLLFALGALILLIITITYAVDEVSNRKFCETCSVFMMEAMHRGVTWAGGRALNAAVAQAQAANLGALLREEQGLDVLITVWKCPKCEAGFLECRGHLEAEWQESGNARNLSKRWLFESISLTRPQLTQLGI